MPLRRRLPLARSFQCKLPGVTGRFGSIGGFIAGGGHGTAGNGGPGIPGVSGQTRIHGSPGSVRNVATKSPVWRLGRFLPEWAAQGAKAQIPGSARSVRQRAFGRPRRIPGGALHIRDQLHLVSGKFCEGQADHYILPTVPCPMIRAGGDLDDRESRWADRDARPNAPRTGGRTGDTGTRPGMVRRSLNKAAVRAAGRSAGGFLHSSPFFLSVWPRSWRTGRSARHHWAPGTAPAAQTGGPRHIVPAPCHAVPRGTVRTPCRLQRVDVCRSACTCERPAAPDHAACSCHAQTRGIVPRLFRRMVC